MKTALITGAARGLGRAIAADLAKDHAVSVTYLTTAPDALVAAFPGIHAIQADMLDPSQVAALPAKVIDRFGQLDIIVNNAAQVAADDCTAYDAATVSQTMGINVSAPMGLLNAALPFLKPGVAVVNISSVNARLPAMSAHSYSASKAALDTWTKIAAKTLGARGIRVNAVAPGPVNTPEAPRPDELTALFVRDTALGRLATPDNIASAVRFLASDAARGITGEILEVSGGYRL